MNSISGDHFNTIFLDLPWCFQFLAMLSPEKTFIPPFLVEEILFRLILIRIIWFCSWLRLTLMSIIPIVPIACCVAFFLPWVSFSLKLYIVSILICIVKTTFWKCLEQSQMKQLLCLSFTLICQCFDFSLMTLPCLSKLDLPLVDTKFAVAETLATGTAILFSPS